MQCNHATKTVHKLTALTALTALLVVAMLSGCLHSKPKVLVPQKESAAAQFAYAQKYESSQNLPLVIDPKKIKEKRHLIKSTYEMVAEYFPEDRKFTPLAKLTVIEMEAGMDNSKVKRSKSQIHKAIEDLTALGSEYPEYEFIQAKTLYDRALCHKSISEFEDSQELFLYLTQHFADNKNAEIKNIVDRATYYYNHNYVVE